MKSRFEAWCEMMRDITAGVDNTVKTDNTATIIESEGICKLDLMSEERLKSLLHSALDKYFAMEEFKETYYVVRTGDYNRGVYYISSDLEACKQRATELAYNDYDSYHWYRVYCCDNKIPTSDGCVYPDPEVAPLFSINKDEATAETSMVKLRAEDFQVTDSELSFNPLVLKE